MSDSSSSEDERMDMDEEQLDYPDEGFESTANTSDVEDIVVGRKHKLPSRPQFHVLSPSDAEKELIAAREGRRLYDRYPRWVKAVSRGDDDEDNRGIALRNMFRTTRTNGDGVTDGAILEARRVTGMAVKAGKIVYFVQWGEYGRESHPMDELLLRWGYPELVIDFHEKYFRNPTKFIKL